MFLITRAETPELILRQGVENNDLVEIQRAIELEVDINADLSGGYTILGAIIKGDIDCIGYRALHFAARNGNVEIIKFLLANNADIHTINDIGNTPLHLAVWHNHYEAAKLLLEQGADANKQNSYTAYRQQAYRETALHYAVLYADKPMVELLVQYRANLACKDAKERTALMLAQESQKTIVIEYLEDVLQRRRREQSEQLLVKLKEWLQRERHFKGSYTQVLMQDYVHHHRYTELYELYQGCYKAIATFIPNLHSVFSQQVLEHDESVVLKQLKKLGEATAFNEKALRRLTKQSHFVQKLLDQTSTIPQETNLSKAIELFDAEEAEHVLHLNQQGLQKYYRKIESEQECLSAARKQLAERSLFFQEITKRITDIKAFPKHRNAFADLVSQDGEELLRLARGMLPVTDTTKDTAESHSPMDPDAAVTEAQLDSQTAEPQTPPRMQNQPLFFNPTSAQTKVVSQPSPVQPEQDIDVLMKKLNLM